MKPAYLVNQYPQPSQSFIRREIAAIESAGVSVARFTLRRWNGRLVDPRDIEEQKRTSAVLDAGALGLLVATLLTVVGRPARFLTALRCAWRMGRRSERGRLLHLVYLAEACVLRQWLAAEGITHLHAHFGTNSTAVALLVHLLGGPSYSFTSHGPEEYDKAPFIALGEKIRRAAFVVAISDFGRSQLYRWCRYEDWSRIHVVRCGVDALFLDPPSAPPAPPTATAALVCVGRLSEQKGQLLLIEAAAMLAQRGATFHLTLVGDGEMRAPIEALIAQRGLGDRVALAGWMSNDQVRQALLDSRALVLPSFAEGLPVVIMEAMALQRPVLSTYVAGIPELVVPGECGWLVPAGSVDALVEALQKVLDASTDELARLGSAGAARVAANHNANLEAQKLLALMRRYAEQAR